MHGLSWLSSLPPSNSITPATHRSASRDVPAKNHCNHQMIHNAKSRAKKRTNIQVLSWNYPKCQRKMQKPWFCPIGMRDILYWLIPFCFLYYRLSSYIYIYICAIIYHIYIIQYMYIYIYCPKKGPSSQKMPDIGYPFKCVHFTNTQIPARPESDVAKNLPKHRWHHQHSAQLKCLEETKKWEETNHPIFWQKKSSTIFSHLILYVKLYCFKLSLKK